MAQWCMLSALPCSSMLGCLHATELEAETDRPLRAHSMTGCLHCAQQSTPQRQRLLHQGIQSVGGLAYAATVGSLY